MYDSGIGPMSDSGLELVPDLELRLGSDPGLGSIFVFRIDGR